MGKRDNKQKTKAEPEKIKRRRELYIILAILFSVILLTFLEAYIAGLRGQSPITGNILVYALININILLLLLLVFLVLRNIVKLFFERRKGILGSKLRTRLVVAFVALSIIPTLLLFGASVSFITNTIENWFSFQVEKSLEESLEVAQTYYENSKNNAIYYAKQISNIITQEKLLNEGNLDKLRNFSSKKQVEYNLGVVEVFSAQLEELALAMNPEVPVHSFTSPSSTLVQQGLGGKDITKIQEAGKGDLIRGIVPVFSTWDKDEVVGVVVVNYYVPQSLVSKMSAINLAFANYKQAKMKKGFIKTSYIITLSIVTLLIIFSAIWFGFFLAKGITVPIQKLAAGTREVANGNLDFQIEAVADDEIGFLVDSFNKMTQDLKSGEFQLEKTNIDLKKTNLDLDRHRRYLEIVLKNVAAGVISLDKEGRIATINKSAEQILGMNAGKVLGQNFQKVLSAHHLEAVNDLVAETSSSILENVGRQIKLLLPEKTLILLINSTVLKDDKGDYLGLVLVFDDLTELQKAQRVAAWREVARRIAHEIKNPLTPIQLSAQRLRRKYGNQFSQNGKIFNECTKIIIDQVGELKNLVNEFSNFARLPTANLVPNNLNIIIEETLPLFREAHKKIGFTFEKMNRVPIFDLDKEQMKRVMINLLDNAVASIDDRGEIVVKTFYDKDLQVARIEISDTGCGIPPEDKPKLFEPYFSTKKKGTGLGLTIVKAIVSDHNGYVRAKDRQPEGTRFIIELPVKA